MLLGCKFHHIGYAVVNIDTTANSYIMEGWSLSESIMDPLQNVKIAFLSREGMPLIELVEAINEESPVKKILEKSGVSPYHICYEVDDIELAIKKLKKHRFVKLFKPVPAIALNNRLICYLFNNDIGLIEIIQ